MVFQSQFFLPCGHSHAIRMPRLCVRLFDRLQKLEGAHDSVSIVGITSTAVVAQPQHFGMQRFAILLTALSAWSVMPDLSPVNFAAVGVSAYLSHFGHSIVSPGRLAARGRRARNPKLHALPRYVIRELGRPGVALRPVGLWRRPPRVDALPGHAERGAVRCAGPNKRACPH